MTCSTGADPDELTNSTDLHPCSNKGLCDQRTAFASVSQAGEELVKRTTVLGDSH